MAIARYSPLSDLVSLRDAMDQLFQESFIRPNGWSGLPAEPPGAGPARPSGRDR